MGRPVICRHYEIIQIIYQRDYKETYTNATNGIPWMWLTAFSSIISTYVSLFCIIKGGKFCKKYK